MSKGHPAHDSPMNAYCINISPFESQKGTINIQRSSVESQKGIIVAQRCSVENQKGAITVQSLDGDSGLWLSTAYLWIVIEPFWLSTDYIVSWEPEGRYCIFNNVPVENQKGAIAIDFVQQ